MCKHCDDYWKISALQKRDFQHSKDGPEEITGRPKKKAKTKQWCRGKEGREHEFEARIWLTYNVKQSDGSIKQEHRYRNMCKKCGMNEWNYRPKVPKHEHHYCKTEITDRRWKHAQEIFEVCCVCGGKGRSYKFYD